MQNRHVPVDPTARCKISPLSCGCREAQKSSIPPQLSRGEILDAFGLDPEIAAVAAVPAIVRNEESGQLLSPAIVWKLPPGQCPGEIIKNVSGFPSKSKNAICLYWLSGLKSLDNYPSRQLSGSFLLDNWRVKS